MIHAMNAVRRLFLLAAVLALAPGFLFADFAVGAQASFDVDFFADNYIGRPPLSVSIRSDESPWCLAASVFPFDKDVSVTADNWFVNESLSRPLSWYALWGISAGAGFDSFSVGTGARLGLGLDLLLLENKKLELYWQLAWNPYFGIEDDDGLELFIRPLVFPFATGARWWIR